MSKQENERMRWVKMSTIGLMALCVLVAIAPGVGAQDKHKKRFDAKIHAAERGDAVAQYNVGWAYRSGYPIEEDRAKAAKWFRLSAEQGFAPSQYELGYMYDTGTRSVPQSYSEAIKWYRLAAQQDHAEAQMSLGLAYFLGKGAPQDKAEAVKWFRLSAGQGYGVAQNVLGLLYAAGDEVPQDYIQAHMWLNLAVASGHLPDGELDEAAEMRDSIGMKLNAEELARTQALARDWKPTVVLPVLW